jgi:hypothetical protein
MRTKLIALVVAAFLAPTLGGCIVHTHDRHRHRGHSTVRRPACHPSQYWDGDQCRHKGRGHGARKHDRRR